MTENISRTFDFIEKISDTVSEIIEQQIVSMRNAVLDHFGSKNIAPEQLAEVALVLDSAIVHAACRATAMAAINNIAPALKDQKKLSDEEFLKLFKGLAIKLTNDLTIHVSKFLEEQNVNIRIFHREPKAKS